MNCNMNYRSSRRCIGDHMPEKEHGRHRPPYKPQTETILRCGTTVGSLPLCGGGGMQIENGYDPPPNVLATLSLDTGELVDPTVKIDFSSLIQFKTFGDDEYFLHLTFRLTKLCSSGPICLGNWTFERIHHEGGPDADGPLVDGCEFIQQTQAFGFSWCECEGCSDCCRYIIEIVEPQCCNIEFASVSNLSLSAIAVGVKKLY